MFDRLCALLVRLYPAAFRDVYGADALQLMRDRAREERGVVPRARLLLDLLRDLFATSLTGWPAPAPLVPAAGHARVPSFHIIETKGPRPVSLVLGMFTSTLMFAAFTLLFQARHYVEPPARLGNAADAEPGSPADGAESDGSGDQAAAGGAGSDPRTALVYAVAARLQEHYVDRGIGQQLANAVLAAHRNGAYERAAMDGDIATRLTTTIHNTAQVIGIPPGVYVADVVYSERPIPEGPPTPTSDWREQRRLAVLERNCFYEKNETLPGNIGYVKLDGFADAGTCRDITARVMTSMNDAAALIVDLRDNTGGFGDTVLQIGGYLFDEPVAFFDPRSSSSTTARTTPISGMKLPDKPVYVLTSSRTQSAAEQFSYNLKMLRRATIVGERTAGRQHSGGFYRINNHFGMGIQHEPRPDNPFPVKGWEVIGVDPDVPAARYDALDVAIRLAQRR